MPKIIETEDGQSKIEIAHSPETVAKVDAWLAQNRQASAPISLAPPAEAQAALPKDIVEQPNEQNQIMEEALPKEPDVVITEEDETLYIKAVLNDAPVILDIKLFGGKINLTFRTRTMFEQEKILALVREDIKDGLIEQGDAAMAFTRIQQYAVCIQLLKWNGDTCAAVELAAYTKMEDIKMRMRELLVSKVGKLSQVKWLAIAKGLVIFETKCRTISEKALNLDFPTPLV